MNVPYVHTAVRVRIPFLNEDVFVSVDQQYDLIKIGGTNIRYNVDYLLECGYPQELVFETAAKPLLDKFIRGEEDVSFIAFGPKFGGKTYTLFGHGVELTDSAIHYGIYSRLASYIFTQYEPSMITGNDPQVIIEVSFFEVIGSKIIDLLDVPNDTNCDEKKIDELRYYRCNSARCMMQFLTMAWLNKRKHELWSHLFAKVAINQPSYRDGEYSRVKTTAVFAELGAVYTELPNLSSTTTKIIALEDMVVLNCLARTHGGMRSKSLMPLEDNHLFTLLKSSFSGERTTLAFCCLPPGSQYMDVTNGYLLLLANIIAMRLSPTPWNQDDLRNKNVPCINTNSLISEAESLLSKLSVSQSISDEDKEKLRTWLKMKKECEEESINAQSHGHLECIEEVTESEEEIASSDEKMSESPISMDNSFYESDQEEGYSKVLLSDNDFITRLDTMCFQFNAFVDNFVDSFKSVTCLEAGKQRKTDYSVARRGGMPEIPKVNELQVRSESSASCNVTLDTQQNNTTYNSGGCIRKTSNVLPHKVEIYQSDEEIDEEKIEDRSTNALSSNEERKRRDKKRNLAIIEKYDIDSKPADHHDKDILQLLKQQENDLQTVIKAWVRWLTLFRTSYWRYNKDKKDIMEEIHKTMFLSVAGIDPFVVMMKSALRIPHYDTDEQPGGFTHLIRLNRYAKSDFTKHKTRLDAKIKDKTATDSEIKDYLMADEMIECLDACMEIINHVKTTNRPYELHLPNTPVSSDFVEKMRTLTTLEMRHLIYKYFLKVVDLRENSKQMERTIAEYEQKLDVAQTKINNLSRFVHDMRTQTTQMQTMLKYTRPGEGAYGEGASASPLALTEGTGAKSKRGPSIPQQNLSKLQVNKAAPPPKVTFRHNKLIIEKPNN